MTHEDKGEESATWKEAGEETSREEAGGEEEGYEDVEALAITEINESMNNDDFSVYCSDDQDEETTFNNVNTYATDIE